MKRLATLAAAGLAAIALGGCGSSEQGLLPPAEAQELLANLAAIETLADERKCLDAAAASQALVGRMGELGNEVDEELRRALVNGAERLVTLARDPESCTGERSEGPEPPAEEDREQDEDTGGEPAPADEGNDEQAPQGDQPQDEPTDGDGDQPDADGDQDGGSTDQPPTESTPQLPGPPAGSGGTTPEGGTAP